MRCDVCGIENAELHHVYFGTGNRKISDKHGFVEWLCPEHHRGQPIGIHGGNVELDLKYKRKHQMIFELELMSDGVSREKARDKFRKIVGKSYL